MAWDPTQGQEQPGNGEQGQPANGGPEPNPANSAPQNPYEGQGQPPSGADPNSGYGTPPNQQGGYGYGYAPPQQAPRSIGQAIQELPNQYIRVLTKPSAQTFAEEMGKADWAMVWIQLLAIALIGTILGFIRAAIGLAASSSFSSSSGFNPNAILALSVGGSTFSIISIPVSFFILVGIQYLLAKAFQGQGRFLTQGYTTLLYQTPIYIISFIIGIIPIFGGLIGAVLYIYSIVLNVFAIMAVHRLSGGKATAVVLIPIVVLFLLLFLCVIAVAALFFAATRNSTP